jgi:Flp pilus assembly protein TadD
LNPNNDTARARLGMALGMKGDVDGAAAEFHEALRVNPNNGSAHFGLGAGLEYKGDLRGALKEYRTACTLDPKNADYRHNYERLLQQLNQ